MKDQRAWIWKRLQEVFGWPTRPREVSGTTAVEIDSGLLWEAREARRRFETALAGRDEKSIKRAKMYWEQTGLRLAVNVLDAKRSS